MGRWRVFAGVAFVAACATEGPARFCEAVCDGVERCEGPVSESCVDDCVRDNPGLAHYTTDALDSVGDCIDDLSCTKLNNEGAFVPCFAKAEATLAVPDETRNFCEEHARRLFECGYGYSTADCERDYVIMTQSFVDSITACHLQSDCEALTTCIDAIWEAA